MGELLPGGSMDAGAWVTWPSVLGLVAGVIALGGGLWLVRVRGSDRGTPTRLTAGMSCLIAGYHLVSWSLPAGWLALRVPVERWWLVAGGVLVAIGGSVAIDLFERRQARGAE